MINNSKNFDSRLWPYIQFKDHREYLTADKDMYLEGLYLDYNNRVWRPQTQDYLLKAIDEQIEFLKIIGMIEEATEDFNREAYSKWYAQRCLQKKLEDTIQ